MRVAIAGAGAVGRSIARELLGNGHEVLLVDKDPRAIKVERVPDAEWLLADACEMSSLQEAQFNRCDVVIAASGDDKVNLVVSLLAKSATTFPSLSMSRVTGGVSWVCATSTKNLPSGDAVTVCRNAGSVSRLSLRPSSPTRWSCSFMKLSPSRAV